MTISIPLMIAIGGILTAILLSVSLYLGKKEVDEYKTVNDKVLYATYTPRRAYVRYYGILGYFILVGFFARGEVLLVALSLGINIVLAAEIAHQKSRIVLTENTLIMTKGFIARDVTSINYGDIKVVELKENEIGRFLRYADLYIDVVGAKNTFIFKRVQKPLQVKRDIETKREEHISKLEGD